MKKAIAICIFVCCTDISAANVNNVVKTEYMELHTGAGRGFPVVNVVEQGEEFKPLLKKYDWIKIESSDGAQGWVSYKDYLAATKLKSSNLRKKISLNSWQFGGRFGLMKSDPSYSAFLAYYPIKNLGFSADLGQIDGIYSNSTLLAGNLILAFFRDAVVSPNVTIGLGNMYYKPREALFNASNEQYGFFRYGGGLSYAPYKRLVLELSFNNTIISDLDNYWGAGFAVSVFF